MDTQKKKKITRIIISVFVLLMMLIFTVLLTKFNNANSSNIKVLSAINYLKADLVEFYYYYNKFPENLAETDIYMDLSKKYSKEILNSFQYIACNNDLSECGNGIKNPQNYKIEYLYSEGLFNNQRKLITTRDGF